MATEIESVKQNNAIQGHIIKLVMLSLTIIIYDRDRSDWCCDVCGVCVAFTEQNGHSLIVLDETVVNDWDLDAVQPRSCVAKLIRFLDVQVVVYRVWK